MLSTQPFIQLTKVLRPEKEKEAKNAFRLILNYTIFATR